MLINATIDTEAQMSYITLSTNPIAQTIEHNNYNLDIDADGAIVGIEIYGIIAIDDITSGGIALDIDIDLGDIA